jgi:substrate import-associated zinc metallohydrolase lipoprotein
MEIAYKKFTQKINSEVKLSFLLLLLSLAFVACKEENLGNVEEVSGLGGDKWVPGPIDKWIDDSLVAPYNISVSYKWDQFEYGELTKILTPTDESKVIPMMSAICRTWIAPYLEVAGLEFFNRYSPKFFILSGSYRYNSDGSFVAGQAEGGRKVILLGANYFKVKGMEGYDPGRDSTYVKMIVIRAIQHEFGHILHQNIMYPSEYRQISKGKYQGGNWINYDDGTALRDGFITSYAMSGFDDDFVEMIAIMLVEGKAGFDKIVNSIPEGTSDNGTTKAQAQQALRSKEAAVVDYYKKAWKIDFYALQAASKRALNGVF